MAASLAFILIYSAYVAIAVSFGNMEGSAFIHIILGSAIIFGGQLIAKIYYTILI